MKLYNCETPLELKLQSKDITKLSIDQLKELVKDTHNDFHNVILENEIIVVDALAEIALELATRCE